SASPRHLHSFPTRRSSDLAELRTIDTGEHRCVVRRGLEVERGERLGFVLVSGDDDRRAFRMCGKGGGDGTEDAPEETAAPSCSDDDDLGPFGDLDQRPDRIAFDGGHNGHAGEVLEQLACAVERLLGVAPAILVLGYGRDRRIGGIEVDRYLVGHDDGQSHLSAQRQSGTVLEGSGRVRGAVEADEDSHIAFGKIVGDAICRGGDFVTHDHPFTCRYSGSGGTGISGSRFAPLLPYYFCTLSSTICRKMESRRSGIAMFQAGSRRSEHLERSSALFVR